MKNILISCVLISSFLTITACSQYGKVVNSQVQTNAKSVLNKPYVLLISLDGFRWDYVDRFKPPHLTQFIKNGVKAESLIPTFPSKTFPNHYSIATGMYPDKHNIVGNSFYDHSLQAKYSINNRIAVEDGNYYAGIPIWVRAAQAGMVTASYFFIGSEAEISGFRPTEFYNFDGKTTKQARVNQILNWLALPKKTRPHLLTLYFSDMDNAGHDFGPNNDKEIKKALFELDSALGDLFNGIKESKLPVNIILVSDHGMMDVVIDNYIPTSTVENDTIFRTVDNGSLLNIHPHNLNQTLTVFQNLKEKEQTNNFKVYLTENTPGFEYIPKNKNWGAIQVLADKGYYFSSEDKIQSRINKSRSVFGQHGFDPINKEMHGIFYANGPAFKKGLSIPSFRNIHIYPIMCEILGLEVPHNIDGDINQLFKALN